MDQSTLKDSSFLLVNLIFQKLIFTTAGFSPYFLLSRTYSASQPAL